MFTIDRRAFLSGLGGFVFPGGGGKRNAAVPSASGQGFPGCVGRDGWRRLLARRRRPVHRGRPFPAAHHQILLTATCFPGIDGYRDHRYATQYQILLYDHTGKEIPLDNGGKLEDSRDASHPAQPREPGPARFLLRQRQNPRGPFSAPGAARGDLFSAGFVRWNLPSNFDNIHAHPAPPQQIFGHFNYSMPFPALSRIPLRLRRCSIPTRRSPTAPLRVVDRLGRTVGPSHIRLRPHQTKLYSIGDLKAADTPGEALAIAPLAEPN